MNSNLTADGERFLKSWQQNYPETPPINYWFKSKLRARWMRIHSLPNAKRYPDDKTDWDILLSRQNEVIDYLVPQDAPITWVWNWLDNDCHIFKSFDLTRLGVFRYDEAEYESWMMDDLWESGIFDTFLMMIAGEQMRAFLIAPDCLISPYDGGMDVILKDPHTAHAFKRHFANWVSPREDRL
jgi:hypothetical protein